ncbi:DUF6151 family protein [Alkalinema sp. FACHB-956]|uniref:DUF6151 family protein n=1 Tax=Alkalinema sp. FACHB-956 TaxID=2692768 RepID=UPI001F54BA79|nr:DUF6151 family protein [Alkalinema sp. FACHB-956]
MPQSIRCHCGKLQGTLNHSQTVSRCVCYCADCQAFARFLKREHEILDEMGGTNIIQTLPANITFTEGIENLTCMRLTDTGMLRWYAACCNTPIGNTLATPNLSFIGVIHTCLSLDQTSLQNVFGPIRMYVNTESAIGETKPKSAGVLSGTLRVMGMMLKARCDGRYKQTPFFVMESSTPIVVPKVLNAEELKNVKNVG